MRSTKNKKVFVKAYSLNARGKMITGSPAFIKEYEFTLLDVHTTNFNYWYDFIKNDVIPFLIAKYGVDRKVFHAVRWEISTGGSKNIKVFPINKQGEFVKGNVKKYGKVI